MCCLFGLGVAIQELRCGFCCNTALQATTRLAEALLLLYSSPLAVRLWGGLIRALTWGLSLESMFGLRYARSA